MEPQVKAAFVALAGVVLGLIGRDVAMALYLANQRRKQELLDRRKEKGGERHDVFRLYADPLRHAVDKLRYRLIEIIDRGPASYLLTDAPPTTYDDYKKLSTLYRLAAVLGWIQAFRRERSYLDPVEISVADEIETAIALLEKALADGQHVELRRLNELLTLWHVPATTAPSDRAKDQLAAEIDALLRAELGKKEVLSASELDDSDAKSLCQQLASLVARRLSVSIPELIITTEATRARALLAIREAYIYRDWQAAIGDLMLHELSGTSRRFDVIGYGQFEERFRGTTSVVRALVWAAGGTFPWIEHVSYGCL